MDPERLQHGGQSDARFSGRIRRGHDLRPGLCAFGKGTGPAGMVPGVGHAGAGGAPVGPDSPIEGAGRFPRQRGHSGWANDPPPLLCAALWWHCAAAALLPAASALPVWQPGHEIPGGAFHELLPGASVHSGGTEASGTPALGEYPAQPSRGTTLANSIHAAMLRPVAAAGAAAHLRGGKALRQGPGPCIPIL